MSKVPIATRIGTESLFFCSSTLLGLFCLAFITGCGGISFPSHPHVTQSKVCAPSAHRGDRRAGSDNSYLAIKSALVAQLPYVEIDLRLTKSGQFALFHDRTLTPQNSVAPSHLHGRTIDTLTPEELILVKHPDGSKILELHELLPLAREHDSLLQLDLKPDSDEALERLVTIITPHSEVIEKLIVQCQHIQCRNFLAQRAPKLKVLARIHDPSQIREALELSPFIIQVDAELLNEQVTNEAKSKGALVLVKSLGEPPDTASSWTSICDNGADIILTDTPFALREHFLRQHTTINFSEH